MFNTIIVLNYKFSCHCGSEKFLENLLIFGKDVNKSLQFGLSVCGLCLSCLCVCAFAVNTHWLLYVTVGWSLVSISRLFVSSANVISSTMGYRGWDDSPCLPVDSILKLMTVWRITGKITRITIVVNYICTSRIIEQTF